VVLIKPTLNVDNRMQWRRWLEENYKTAKEIWLVYHRAKTEVPTITYAQSVDEAFCFGWVDGLIKKIDDERYARRFSPRRKDGDWSRGSVVRFNRLKREGRLTQAALDSGPTKETKVHIPLRERKVVMPKEFRAALAKSAKVKNAFSKLAPSYRKLLIHWVSMAKRPETRVARIKRVITSLKEGRRLWQS
jgi:uncharacterized protein YdeI (YjbR/CyaY-like superfamily)